MVVDGKIYVVDILKGEGVVCRCCFSGVLVVVIIVLFR